MMAECRKINHW